jgi:broad specificity phosphatase PhoE
MSSNAARATHRRIPNVTARLTLISHAPTPSMRRAAFPIDEPITPFNLNWQPPRAQQILTAPELRTQQTAQSLNLTATTTPELRDYDYGTWQGLDLTEVHTKNPEAITSWLTDPNATPSNGESIVHLIHRTATWLDARRDQGHTLAITHPAVIRAAILHTLGAPPQSFWRIDIAPLTLTDLRHNGNGWTLRATAIPLTPYPLTEA